LKKDIIIIGQGGHSLACQEVIDKLKKYKIVGFVVDDKHQKKNDEILGSDEDLKEISKKYKNAFIGIGSPHKLDVKKNLYLKLKNIGFNLPTIVSKNAIVSSSCKIGEGSIIMDGVQIGPKVVIGKNCIINSKTLIEHECKIEDHCNIATSVTLNGNCQIKEKTFVGSGSVVRENSVIKKNSFIKMGTIKI